jgi:hypothetical protein
MASSVADTGNPLAKDETEAKADSEAHDSIELIVIEDALVSAADDTAPSARLSSAAVVRLSSPSAEDSPVALAAIAPAHNDAAGQRMHVILRAFSESDPYFTVTERVAESEFRCVAICSLNSSLQVRLRAAIDEVHEADQIGRKFPVDELVASLEPVTAANEKDAQRDARKMLCDEAERLNKLRDEQLYVTTAPCV